MVPKKAKSKRQTLSDKFKIERRCKEHNRKMRKAQRNGAPGVRKGLKKDPGIPNLWPFKESFIRQMEAKKKQEDLQKERERERRRQLRNGNLSSLAMEADNQNQEYEMKEDITTDGGTLDTWTDGSRRAYYKELQKVISKADVILEVLDARDPMGCRCPQLERMIQAADGQKKIVLILNKIDLVPKDVVQRWLKYLRNSFATIAFKASTQSQRNNLGQSKVKVEKANADLLASSESIGTETLVKLLKNYSRSSDMKKSITVGIVGYPNVGKSSLINSLKRAKTCQVGAQPGMTKVAQEIQLDKNLKLLDSPGVVFASNNTDSDVILRNCVNVDTIPDPVDPVRIILSRCNAEQVMQLYQIPAYNDINEFLISLASRRGHLKRGGVIDVDATARSVLRDWNSGAIPFYTEPPQVQAEARGTAQVMQGFSKAFDLGGLLQMEEDQMLEALASKDHEFVSMLPTVVTEEGIEVEDDDEMAMDDPNQNLISQGYEMTKSQKRKGGLQKGNSSIEPDIDDETYELNPQVAKENARANKISKREAQRRNKQNQQASSSNDNYSFDTDFVQMDEEEEDHDFE